MIVKPDSSVLHAACRVPLAEVLLYAVGTVSVATKVVPLRARVTGTIQAMRVTCASQGTRDPRVTLPAQEPLALFASALDPCLDMRESLNHLTTLCLTLAAGTVCAN